MFNFKIPIYIKLIWLLLLPILACAIPKNSTPSPMPTPTLSSSSLTKIAKEIPRRLTRIAKKTLQAPTATITPTIQVFIEKTPAPAHSSKPTATPTATFSLAAQFPTSELLTIPAPALTDNLLGEVTTQNILIYLPASYFEPERRYPVVYYLLDSGIQMRDISLLPADIQKDVTKSLTKEMIVVFVSGTNVLGNSFYVNSPITGNWDDFVAQDVVRYVDSHYRSIPAPASRGITGYGVGGFGALSVAMRHPDVFGAVYSISPTLFDNDGLPASPMFSVQRNIDAMLELQVRELPLSVNDGVTAMKYAGDAQYTVAYGAAFVYNTQIQPPYIDYPYYRQNGRIFRDEAIWQRWQTGFGAAPEKIQAYKAGLLKLNKITLACSKNAPSLWIWQGCQYFSTQLTKANIQHTLFTGPRDVEPDFEQGIRAYALPFFSTTLIFDPQSAQ